MRRSELNASVLAPVTLNKTILKRPSSHLITAFFNSVESSPNPTPTKAYVTAAFELLAQVIEETGTAESRQLMRALRRSPHDTLLGELRSGETGELKPLSFQIYSSQEKWSPATAVAIDNDRLFRSYETETLAESKSPVAEVPSGLSSAKPPASVYKNDELLSRTYKKAKKPVRATPPEPPRKEPPATVYNVEVEPKESRDPLVLKPQVRTELTFFIGEHSTTSVVKDLKPSGILKDLAASKPLSLTVTMYCLVCETDTHQQRQIVLEPNTGKSNSALFEIVPSLAVVRETNGLGRIIFTVDADVFDLYSIVLNAIVGNPTSEALSAYRSPVKLIIGSIEEREIVLPDLVIDIAAGGSGKIPVAIRPILPALRQRLAAKLGEPQGQSWTFTSGVSKNYLDGIVADTYLALRTLIDQNESELQKFYRSLGQDTALTPATATLHISDDDFQKMLGVLRGEGAQLYSRIFRRGEPCCGTQWTRLKDLRPIRPVY